MSRHATLAAAWPAFLLATGSLLAAPLPEGEPEQRCWAQHTRERTAVNLREPTTVEFSNLRDGYAVRSPFLVGFAVRGMGVTPAGVALEGTGHHHILINKPLPTSLTEQLPFDDSHRHFGKGQTHTMLDLKPGRHTLRLLFADHEHRPYFVFSRQINVEVRGAREQAAAPKIDANNFEGSCRRWYEDQMSSPRPDNEPLFFANVRAAERLASPFNLRLGSEKFGICARTARATQCGHFVFELLDAAQNRSVQTTRLANGATQINVFVGVGDYRLRLRLVDAADKDLLPPHELPVKVIKQENT
jgi:hypothetical protein